jgi:integrase
MRESNPVNSTRQSKPGQRARLRYVQAVQVGEATYLYYRRGGHRIRLPGPEGSEAFHIGYNRAHKAFGEPAKRQGGQTIDDAVTAYLTSADYRSLKDSTRMDYRRTLDRHRAEFGEHALAAFTEAKIARLRDQYAPDPDAGLRGQPIEWNALRSRMIMVFRHWRLLHPGTLASNPWEASRRLKVPPSNSHRPWSPEVLSAVMRAATPEFRALLTAYLLTSQRGGDVTKFSPAQYDRKARTLNLAQGKTGEELLIHVPDALAAAIEAMRGRLEGRLFVTPRGMEWTLGNAQETLARLLEQLGLGRYTLHGLRATGPVALKMMGFENRAIRELTGHTSDRNLEIYLRGVKRYPLARVAQEALAKQFGSVISKAGEQGNERRYSGVTGRASGKSLANGKTATAKKLVTT